MKYSVPSLNEQTPKSEQAKLTSALKGVKGVQKVTLRPGTQQFEIEGKAQGEPKFKDISAASQRAGFKVVPKDAPRK